MLILAESDCRQFRWIYEQLCPLTDRTSEMQIAGAMRVQENSLLQGAAGLHQENYRGRRYQTWIFQGARIYIGT